MWQVGKKEVIITKFKDKIGAIGISMENWLNGTEFEEMSFMNFNELIKVGQAK